MQLGSKKTRKITSFLLETVIVIFIISLSIPVYSAVPIEENREVVQTTVSSPIPFNTPSEQPFSSDIGKVLFVAFTFLPEKLLDLPGQEIERNPAILKNSCQHNVFYVKLTAKAP